MLVLLREILHALADGVEDGCGRGARRQAERHAELPVEVPATECRVVAVGQAETLGRQYVAKRAQHAGLAGAGLSSQDELSRRVVDHLYALHAAVLRWSTPDRRLAALPA